MCVGTEPTQLSERPAALRTGVRDVGNHDIGTDLCRFSCKYHGWQYDDQGRLIKAPQFEDMPGFVPADNSLFEIKLIVTSEGLIYVNFDANTMHLPFNNVKAGLNIDGCKWLDGVDIECSTNWKQLGEHARKVS